MATIVASATGGNWSSTAAWVGGVVPTATSDVQLNASSGPITIDLTTTACRSLDCTGYTNTLTQTAGMNITIGDATAGLSSIALKFVAGMTYTLGDSVSCGIIFNSSSATQLSIDFAGKTTASVNMNNTGSWIYQGTHLMGSSASMTLTKGILNTNGQSCTWGAFGASSANSTTLTLGASQLTITRGNTIPWNVTNMTLNAGTSQITFTGSGPTTLLLGTNYTYYDIICTGNGNVFTGTVGNTFHNFTRTGTAAKGDTLQISGNCTINGVLTVNGNSAINRVFLLSDAIATQRVITNANAPVLTNVDIMDIQLTTAYDASGITGGSGDCGGNTGITFTSSVSQTWSGTSGGNWSTNAWTSRVPLPQDDVVMGKAFIASQTIVADMPRLGRSISWTGATGSPTFNFGSVGVSVYGSLTLITGMTISGSQGLSLCGRGSYTLTNAGRQFQNNVTIYAPGGTYTTQDNFNNGPGVFQLVIGSFSTNQKSMTSRTFVGTGSLTRALDMTNSTWTIGDTGGSPWNVSSSGFTLTVTGSTIYQGTWTANTRTFAGGGMAYNILTYANGSAGTLLITGANTFNTINCTPAASNTVALQFAHGIINTIAGSFNVNGISGFLVTINSDLAGSAATLNFTGAGIVNCDYLSIKDSTPAQANTWFAGNHSTAVSNTGSWVFGHGNTLSLAGGLGFAANEPKQTNIPLSAGMTFAGGFLSGVIHSKLFTAALNLIGMSNNRTSRNMAGSLIPTAAFRKQTGKSVAGNVGFAGVFNKLINRAMTASASFAGNLLDMTVNIMFFVASIGFSATTGKRANKGLSGTVGFSATIKRAFTVPFTASIALIGSMGKTTVKRFTAAVSFFGAFGRSFYKSFSAAIGFTGKFGRSFVKMFIARLGFGNSSNPGTTDSSIGGEDFGEAAFGGGGVGITPSVSVASLTVTYIKSKGLSFIGTLITRLVPRIGPSIELHQANKEVVLSDGSNQPLNLRQSS